MYSYDPVGSYEREEFRAGGTAAALLQPLLDNQVSAAYTEPNTQIGYKNQQNVVKVPLTKVMAFGLELTCRRRP